MDLSQKAASIENFKNSNKKQDSGKFVIYRLKSSKLGSISPELDKNIIKKIKESQSSKEHRICSELNS